MQTELNKVVTALEEFYARETFLLERDLGERTLTHRLAVYIEKQFRDGKSIAITTGSANGRCGCRRGSIVSTDDDIGKSVYPDIVVHQREIPNNLLAIEVRKAANHQPPEHDQHKLRGLTDPHLWFAYRIGVYPDAGKKRVTVSDVYVGGVIDQPLSGWFSERLRDAGLGVG